MFGCMDYNSNKAIEVEMFLALTTFTNHLNVFVNIRYNDLMLYLFK